MPSQQLIFVFGCQRSGTTATINGLKQLENCVVFDEENTVTNVAHPEYDAGLPLRLKPLDQLRAELTKISEPLIILKPLVESQNARRLLEQFPGSVGLWLFRDYRDVVQSMLNRWSDRVGFTLLRFIAEGRNDDWRAEHASNESRELASEMLAKELTPADAAAMFWLLRNRLFFEQNLDSMQQIKPVQYSRVVQESGYLRRVLADLGVPIAIDDTFYNKNSLGKGSNVELMPEISRSCDKMLKRLIAVASKTGQGC